MDAKMKSMSIRYRKNYVATAGNERKKRICFIAQFPSPLHGLSKAVETLYGSGLNRKFDFEKVDVTDNKRFLKNLKMIKSSKADLFYFTISQTRNGNIRDLIILKLLELQHKKCLVHLHGGHYRKMVDGEIKEKLEGFRDKEVIHVLWLGNFIRSKGYPTVLELAKLEKERVEAGGKPRFHFDFAGKFFEKSEKMYFEEYVKEKCLDKYITYHGVVDGDEKRVLLRLGDIFVLPTRYPNEGQPISILEAMGNGMLIVTTDHAGIPDIVKDGENGIVASKDMGNQKLYARLREIIREFSIGSFHTGEAVAA